MIEGCGRIGLVQLLVIRPERVGLVGQKTDMIGSSGLDAAKVKVMKLMVDPRWHFGCDNEQAMRCEDQDAIFMLVSSLELEFDRHLEQDFGVFAQEQPDRLVNVTSHRAARCHFG